MKKLLLLFAAVGTLLTACNNNDTEYVYDDHSADLVGTWTCLTADFAEALVISADGKVVSTGVAEGEYWEGINGTVEVKDGKMTLTFEDGDNFEGHFDIIPGVAFSIYNEQGGRMVFNYCKEDLSDEVVGMWVCNDATTGGESMMIQTFYETGKCTLTGFLPLEADSEQVLNNQTDYNVVGDLLFISVPADKVGGDKPLYVVDRIIYSPNGTNVGDIMTLKTFVAGGDQTDEVAMSFLRVKQSLDLAGTTYAYSSAYVSNAKGKDEDFTILGKTFNMANITGGHFDVIFGSELYCVELNANSITHKFRPNGQDVEVETPITVDGNKVTLDMSTVNPACRKVDMYMFQDADNSQLHIYMPTSAFINYFVNLEIPALISEGKLDPTDIAAVEKLFTDMEARIESINVSFVMKAFKEVL